MPRRALAALAVALAVLAGCSDEATPGADATVVAGGSAAPDDSRVTDGSGGSQGTNEGTGDTGPAGTNASGSSGSSTTKPGGTGGSTPTGGTQPSGGTSPSTTLPPVMPPPPVAGCVDAPAGTAIVELSFDDDTMRYAGAVAPPCVRLHAAQRLRVLNAAHFSSTGSIGAQTYSLAEGASTTTSPLGTTRSVGDVFVVRVNVLSASVVVQVLP